MTYDKADFQRLHSQWMLVGREHAGLIIVSSIWISPARIAAGIMRLQAERSPEDMRNAILFLGPSPIEENA